LVPGIIPLLTPLAHNLIKRYATKARTASFIISCTVAYKHSTLLLLQTAVTDEARQPKPTTDEGGPHSRIPSELRDKDEVCGTSQQTSKVEYKPAGMLDAAAAAASVEEQYWEVLVAGEVARPVLELEDEYLELAIQVRCTAHFSAALQESTLKASAVYFDVCSSVS
jgi:hypothetical protein